MYNNVQPLINRAKEKNSWKKLISKRETKNQETKQIVKVGWLKMNPQGQPPSPQASNKAKETEKMQEV